MTAIAAAAFMAALVACDSSECSDNRNSLPLAGFMSSSSTPQSVAFDTLRISGLGAPNDSVLTVYDSSQAYLPFNIESHTTSFVFAYNNIPEELNDTLTFTYDINPWFESSKCGVIYRYDVNGISHTTHFVDSVRCPGGVIDNTPGQNIFIYFRTESGRQSLPAHYPNTARD